MIPTKGVKWRLWQWRVWWAHTWWFQFAHNPLCARFSCDVLRIGKWRICRSCTLLYSGAAVTAIALALERPPGAALLVPFFGVAAPVMAISYPPVYGLLTRRMRDAARLSAGVLLALWIGLLFFGQLSVAAATGCAILVVYFLYKRKREIKTLGVCVGCAELGRDGVCTGYVQQAESIRAYCQCIEGVLNRDDVVPPVVSTRIESAAR